jgi:hypothetical protein
MTLSIERSSEHPYQHSIAETEELSAQDEFSATSERQERVKKVGIEAAMITLSRGIPSELQPDDNPNIRLGTD